MLYLSSSGLLEKQIYTLSSLYKYEFKISNFMKCKYCKMFDSHLLWECQLFDYQFHTVGPCVWESQFLATKTPTL